MEFKSDTANNTSKEQAILIESQWNLNKPQKGYYIARIYINRITVEFKLIRLFERYRNLTILIESQWNLNKFVSVCMFAVLHINRITVEFKFT